MRNKILSSVLVVVCAASSLQAENKYQPGAIGRLPDGRPFRVDSSGYRLTDYIAELEVSIDDLKRQVIALENEVADKQKIIGRYADGHTPGDNNVVEEDLLGKPSASAAVSGNSELRQCESARASIEAQLAQARNGGTGIESQKALSVCNTERNAALANVARLTVERDGAEQLASSLRGGVADAEDARTREEEVRARLNDVSGQSSALEKQLEWEKRSQERLGEDNEKLHEQIARLTEQFRQAMEDNKKLDRKYSLLVNAPRGEDDQVTITRSSDSDEPQVVLAAESRQGYARSTQSELSSIQQQIMARKSLLDQLKGSNRGVSPSVQRLVTRGGNSLDQLRSSVKNAQSVSDYERITSGLKEIAAILTQDIAMLKRLIHGRS